MNTNTKKWSLTWDTNVEQKKLPEQKRLSRYLDGIAEHAQFQLEEGSIRKKQHYQGYFVLWGNRKSKRAVLDGFQKEFKNISGLTLSPCYDITALRAYTSKSEGRLAGPWHCGIKKEFDNSLSMENLREWQQGLYDYIVRLWATELPKEMKEEKDRAIYWIEDTRGNTGKSWFQKWLRYGQKELVCKKLPVSSVDRLISAICNISEKEEVDVYMINLTRTQGADQSYKDLFAAIEDIKDGYVVDVMYGKYREAYIKSPTILIFSNKSIADFRSYLSLDRWVELRITAKQELQMDLENSVGYDYQPIEKAIRKKYGQEYLTVKNSFDQET